MTLTCWPVFLNLNFDGLLCGTVRGVGEILSELNLKKERFIVKTQLKMYRSALHFCPLRDLSGHRAIHAACK